MRNLEKFILPIHVSTSHIDERNHVNNLIYLQWCLDAAEKHWHTKTPQKIKDTYVWYVLNHNISYKASAYINDLLEVHTWVSNSKGVKTTRNYTIIRPQDNKIIVEAHTLWCLIDVQTLKPVKIPPEISNLFEK